MIARFASAGIRLFRERALLVWSAALLFAAAAGLSLHPSASAFRIWIWFGITIAALSFGMIVVALHLRGMVQQLSAENRRMRRAINEESLERRRQLAEVTSAATTLSRRTDGLARSVNEGNRQARKMSRQLLKAERVAKRFSEVRSGLAALNGALGRVESRAHTISSKVSKIEERERERHDSFEAKLGEFTRLHYDNQQKTEGALSVLRETSEKELQEIRASLAVFNQRYGGLDEITERLDEKLAELTKRNPTNAPFYQRFNRQLDKQHIKEFTDVWGRKLSVSSSESALGYQAARACQVETFLQGRLAASIEDIMLRTLVARSVKRATLNVLEIGTLFGIGAGVIYDAVAPNFESVHFTLLDPLEGYYGVSPSDVVTGQPVNEELLRRNLRRVGMTANDFTLIKRMSTEPEAIEEAAKRRYDVLIIDGDHSYAGVKTDFENFAPLVRVGGYIIFDDYGAPTWPDVQRYVDAEIAKTEWVAPVGVSWRTAVYRVVRDPAEVQDGEEAVGL